MLLGILKRWGMEFSLPQVHLSLLSLFSRLSSLSLTHKSITLDRDGKPLLLKVLEPLSLEKETVTTINQTTLDSAVSIVPSTFWKIDPSELHHRSGTFEFLCTSFFFIFLSNC